MIELDGRELKRRTLLRQLGAGGFFALAGVTAVEGAAGAQQPFDLTALSGASVAASPPRKGPDNQSAGFVKLTADPASVMMPAGWETFTFSFRARASSEATNATIRTCAIIAMRTETPSS